MRPGTLKKLLLDDVNAAPRGSAERRRAYFAMHRAISAGRHDRADAMDALRVRIESTERRVQDQTLALRRNWPFPLYADSDLDALAGALRCDAGVAGSGQVPESCDQTH